jgi:O-methyltransferase involved in polyketide biosynthesis
MRWSASPREYPDGFGATLKHSEGGGRPMACGEHISETAFLVNESRARNVELSRDRYAHLWVSDDTKKLWEDFSREVYPLDDIELSVRNRFFLERLDAALERDPTTVFVNFGAGFTSYPFLTERPCECIEVDYEHVCDFKRRKITDWRGEGILPDRDVEFIAADLADGVDVERLRAELALRLGERPSVATFEGITYYLDMGALVDLFEMLRGLQRPGSIVTLDFWTPDDAGRPIHARLKRFFNERFGFEETRYNIFDVDFINSLDGYTVLEITDVQELERIYAGTSRLSDPDKIIPEHYAVLSRTGKGS